MRREREAPWSSPIFPYFGWLIAGWVLTWAAVELNMLQRLLDTVSLTGAQWLVVLGLSLVAPHSSASTQRFVHSAVLRLLGRGDDPRRPRLMIPSGTSVNAGIVALIAASLFGWGVSPPAWNGPTDRADLFVAVGV